MNLLPEPLQSPSFWQLEIKGRRLANVAIAARGSLITEGMQSSLRAVQRDRLSKMNSSARAEEYLVSRWLQKQLPNPCAAYRSISHCRAYIAVALSDVGPLGIDVESRLPRKLQQVANHLGWSSLEETDYLQAWTLWEAWRKLEKGSVLDPPDPVYRQSLEQLAEIRDPAPLIAGAYWASLVLQRGWLSLLVRPE